MYTVGTGAGKGWYEFYAFPSPPEFNELLNQVEIYFVYTNRRVGSHYSFTPKDKILDLYDRYYSRILRGKKLDWRIKNDLYIDLTYSLAILSDRNKFFDGFIRYKIFELHEPVIGIRPIEVCYKGSTLTYKPNMLNQDFCFGIAFHFPKNITLPDGKTLDTRDCGNFTLFNQLREMFKEKTVGCRFASGEKVLKTEIRISPKVREAVNCSSFPGCYGLRVL